MINTEQFKRLLADKRPQTAVILGSGLGSVADAVEDPLTIDYAAIEGFPRTTVAGHSGKMIVGRLGQSEVLCLQGRFHLYEGHRPQVIAEVVNALKAVGVNRLIVTNAASTGPRFPDMSNAYDRDMRRQAKELAAKLGINLPEGVYLMVLGPNFETAAEIRAFRTLGADAVGMSTVPEVIAAVHAGIKVLAVSAVTNFGTGLQETPLSHEETIAGAARASSALTALITNYIKEFCHE